MSFKSYALHSQPDGTWAIDDPEPLVLSGRHGLIARFVQSNPERAGRPWALCPGELHALAFPERLLRDRAIFFEQLTGDGLRLQRLQGIHGVSGRRTEMMLSFSPVTMVCSGHPRKIRRAAGQIYNEGLELDGGVLAPTGSWRWGRPHLAIGSVVLSPPSPRRAYGMISRQSEYSR